VPDKPQAPPDGNRRSAEFLFPKYNFAQRRKEKTKARKERFNALAGCCFSLRLCVKLLSSKKLCRISPCSDKVRPIFARRLRKCCSQIRDSPQAQILLAT
jgi:hypothetical protein